MIDFARSALAITAGLLVAVACGGTQHPPPDRGKLLTVGTEVPALMRVDHRGTVVNLRSAEPTLLYFYPKDGTPGCTKEACAIRDAWQQYQLTGLRVIGVSADSEESHRAFADEHGLPFSLVSDPEHAWSDAFGVGSFEGRDDRVSFLIDRDGKIAKVYEKVDPGVHADEVLEDAKALGLSR